MAEVYEVFNEHGEWICDCTMYWFERLFNRMYPEAIERIKRETADGESFCELNGNHKTFMSSANVQFLRVRRKTN